ncbi:MAG: D-alanyl-D-alanine carboxypeptidase (penicillin-binding protein 5/6) [Parcubacteria group bacterium Gr01-1014_33]|nr:MAG: D-alanyl-D-alanine carboxypeptidase (penicillin-binding protein 5/6) [Parcubacteria group bacterium Gr01-1014_33]
MPHIQFDIKGIRYSISLFVLITLIFFIAEYARSSFDTFLADMARDENMPAGLAVIRAPRPEYKELAEDALISPHRKLIEAKRDEGIQKERNFLFANLEEMSVALYQKGELIKSFPIQAKGKEGSFFETPSGIYKVRSKEQNHFSRIGNVWMPWSMHFFGNYFIHGWPYYPNGRPVADSFSGGCIRLGDADAKALFSLSATEMTVLVYAPEGTEEKDLVATYYEKRTPELTKKKNADMPSLMSTHAVLAADLETGQILFEKEKDQAYPIASLTKLMTGLVALETINRFKVLTVTKSAADTFGDTGGLVEGETFTSENLLYPLILASSNDAAARYAEEVPGFIDIMNQKAKAIGLGSTHYEDPTGLTPKNVSSASDTFRLLQFIYNHKRPLFAISSLPEYTLASKNGVKTHTWKNVSWSAGDSRFMGGKSGATPEALQTMAGVYRVRMSEGDARPIAIILLGSRDRVKDGDTIISYLENHFVYGTTLVDTAQKGAKPKVIYTGASIFQAVQELNAGEEENNASLPEHLPQETQGSETEGE